MTVTYSATKSFLRLLFIWKGSVYKEVMWQYLVFLSIYYAINCSYRFAMNEGQQATFEKVVAFFANGNGFIPIQFLLGFYVSRVIANWWDQLNCIAWPDKFLVFVTANVPGQDAESRLLRRTFGRYANLLSTLVWREISLKIKKRFPTERHLLEAGLITQDELTLYQYPPLHSPLSPASHLLEAGLITQDELTLYQYPPLHSPLSPASHLLEAGLITQDELTLYQYPPLHSPLSPASHLLEAGLITQDELTLYQYPPLHSPLSPASHLLEAGLITQDELTLYQYPPLHSPLSPASHLLEAGLITQDELTLYQYPPLHSPLSPASHLLEAGLITQDELTLYQYPPLHSPLSPASHLLEAGLITQDELTLYQAVDGAFGRWSVPVHWMNELLWRCRADGRISDVAHQKLIDELWAFRSGSAMLTLYDWINIPLVYTQVVTLATYGYFAFSLVGRQLLINEEIHVYFPLFTTLEFLFYIGWMSVGEALRCPFGEDDDDFDMNYILDRNIHASNMITHVLPGTAPPLQHSRLWEECDYPKLPHTRASNRIKDVVPSWRLSKISFGDKDKEWVKEGEATEESAGLVSALSHRVFSARQGRSPSPVKLAPLSSVHPAPPHHHHQPSAKVSSPSPVKLAPLSSVHPAPPHHHHQPSAKVSSRSSHWASSPRDDL